MDNSGMNFIESMTSGNSFNVILFFFLSTFSTVTICRFFTVVNLRTLEEFGREIKGKSKLGLINEIVTIV